MTNDQFNRLTATMRRRSWQRAKGELRSMLETFHGEDEEKFSALDAAIEGFIADIEGRALDE